MNIVEIIRKEIQAALAQLAAPQCGVVTSVDPETHSVKVDLELTGSESGWLRLISNAGGKRAGVGMRLPKEGDEVLCIFTDMDHDNGFIVGYVPNEDDEPANGSEDAAGNIDPNALVIAQWENGGRVVVENSRDGSAPILKITNNQGDEITVDQGAIKVKTTGKAVDIETSGGAVTVDTGGGSADLNAGAGSIKVNALKVDIDTITTCTLNGGIININNLPFCMFTGAPHGTNPKNKG
jgi:phage baseplate assembly protein gpV